MREVQEEFALEATVVDFVTSSRFRYDDCEIELLAYEVELAPGELMLNSHDEVRWVEIRELLSYELAPADVPIAEVILQGSTWPGPARLPRAMRCAHGSPERERQLHRPRLEDALLADQGDPLSLVREPQCQKRSPDSCGQPSRPVSF